MSNRPPRGDVSVSVTTFTLFVGRGFRLLERIARSMSRLLLARPRAHEPPRADRAMSGGRLSTRHKLKEINDSSGK